MPEVTVTVVVLTPTNQGGYDQLVIEGVTVNTQAPGHLILQWILEGLKQQYRIQLEIDQVDMFIQGPNGSSLDNYIQYGSKIIIMPRFIAPPVKFPKLR